MDNVKTTNYDWYARRMEEEGFSLKKWSDEEDDLLLSALFGLRDGQLGPFAALLKSSAGGVHPHIAKQLVAMIEGDGDWSDYCLEVKLHGNHKRQSNTLSQKLQKKTRDRRRALVIARHGGHQPNMFEAAIAAASQELNLGRSSLAGIWGNYKKDKEKQVIHRVWFAELSEKHGGLNAVINMQAAGKLPDFPPDGYIVDRLNEKIIVSINHDLKTNNYFF